MGWFDDIIKVPDLGGDRAATLDKVARWLVRDLATRGGVTSAGDLTDAAFAVLHPELGGRKLAASETSLIADYRRIRRDIVDPVLGAKPASSTKPSKRHGYQKKKLGYQRYSAWEGGPRVIDYLRDMKRRGLLEIERLQDSHFDTFQRIANVETSGGVQALNSWDSAIMSIGFMQLTLTHGKLQEWIARAPTAFARYGIELEPTRTWTFDGEPQKAIVGATRAGELRSLDWGDRFYRAGLDDEIIRAEVEDALVRLRKGVQRAKSKLGATKFPAFWNAYVGSLPFRGLYQESLNHHPAGTYRSIAIAASRATDDTSPAAYYQLLAQAMPEGFEAYARAKGKDLREYREKGARLVTKTATA